MTRTVWCCSGCFFLLTEFLCLEVACRIIVKCYVNFWQLNSQDLMEWGVTMGNCNSILVCLGNICINKINRSRSVEWISSCWEPDRYTAFQRVLIGLIWMAISTCRASGALFSHLFRQNWAEKNLCCKTTLMQTTALYTAISNTCSWSEGVRGGQEISICGSCMAKICTDNSVCVLKPLIFPCVGVLLQRYSYHYLSLHRRHK